MQPHRFAILAAAGLAPVLAGPVPSQALADTPARFARTASAQAVPRQAVDWPPLPSLELPPEVEKLLQAHREALDRRATVLKGYGPRARSPQLDAEVLATLDQALPALRRATRNPAAELVLGELESEDAARRAFSGSAPELSQALAAYERGLALGAKGPLNGTLRFCAGFANYALGRLVQARAHYQAVVELPVALVPELRYRLTELALDLGDLAGAQREVLAIDDPVLRGLALHRLAFAHAASDDCEGVLRMAGAVHGGGATLDRDAHVTLLGWQAECVGDPSRGVTVADLRRLDPQAPAELEERIAEVRAGLQMHPRALASRLLRRCYGTELTRDPAIGALKLRIAGTFAKPVLKSAAPAGLKACFLQKAPRVQVPGRIDGVVALSPDF